MTIKFGREKMRILYFVDRASLCNVLQMQPTMCTSSGELTVSMWQWYFALCIGGCLVREIRQPPIESEKCQCRIDTESSPDDGHIFTRNM